MNIRTIYAAAAVMVALGAAAQDLSTEIDVERTVTPEHRAATPLSTVTPAVLTATGTPVLDIAEFTLTAPTAPSAGIFEAEGDDGLPPKSPYRGYAAIGYFPMVNIAAAAGYRIIENESTTLAASLRYEGASWHGLHRSDGTKGNASDHTFGINAGGHHSFGKICLNIDGDYFHTGVTNPLATGKYSRGIDGAAIAARIGASGNMSWNARVHYIYTGVSAAPDGGASPGENRYGISADGRYGIGGGACVFLEAGIEGVGRSGREWSVDAGGNDILAGISHKSMAVAQVVPGVTYSGKAVTARAAVKVSVGANTGRSTVHLAPDVRLAWTPAARFAVYAEARGGEEAASMLSFYNYSPFAVGANAATTQLTSISALAGVRAGSVRGLMAGAEARYEHTDDAAMLQATPAGTAFVPVNLSGWRAKLYVRYGAPFAGAYAKGSIEKLAHTYRHAFAADPDRPEWIADIRIGARPLAALTLEARWQWRGGRCSFRLDAGNATRIDLGDMNDLSIEAVYNINERMACGLTVSNLLCVRYQIVENLRSQGIHGLAGFQYKF